MTQDFKWRHFRGEFILWAVRWYCRYGISSRDLEEMLEERGFSMDHTTIYHLSLGAGLRAGNRKAPALALTAKRPFAILARGGNLRQGQREMGVSVPRGRQPWRHHRLPPVADPQCQRRQAVPGQGAARMQCADARSGRSPA